ncbi:uncharacterized protein [Littorina saxatilis]|uniref:uncharacterized protein n=1 Tax=Littorina saxatilis TaxID=31220 RepID=UPI0038B62F0B
MNTKGGRKPKRPRGTVKTKGSVRSKSRNRDSTRTPKYSSIPATGSLSTISMEGPTFEPVECDDNLREHLAYVKDSRLYRMHRDLLDTMDRTDIRLESLNEQCKRFSSTNTYLKMLKGLYEKTGEIPPNFFMYYLRDEYRPAHVQESRPISAPLGARPPGFAGRSEYLPQNHIRMVQ